MSQADTEVKKEVNMVAYDADQRFTNPREWASELVGVDLTEKTFEVDRHVEINMDLGKREHTFTVPEHRYTDGGIKELKDKIPGDIMSINEVEERETAFAHSSRAVMNEFLEELCQCIPDKFTAGGIEFNHHERWHKRLKWVEQREDDEQINSLKITNPSLEKRRILAKEAERHSDDLYETMAEVPSFRFKIKMDSTSHETIEDLTDGVIPKLHKALSDIDHVGKVRYMACETQETKRGECYDI